MNMHPSFPNLLIIAGTGNKSGKTTIACRIIEQFRDMKIVSIKITPHFHETTPGLILFKEAPGYSVYEERNPGTEKDTSRMLRAGASKVYFAKVTGDTLHEIFKTIVEAVPKGIPLICESPAMAKQVKPGLLIIMSAPGNEARKDLNHLYNQPHIEFNINSLRYNERIPVSFTEGRWISWKYGS
jgi:hypothetical protein